MLSVAEARCNETGRSDLPNGPGDGKTDGHGGKRC